MADLDLVTWLRAQLDARETAINARPEVHVAVAELLGDRLDVFAYGQIERRLWARGLVESKEELLADVEAKRRIIDLYEAADGAGFVGHLLRNSLDTPLRLLALPFAGRPGWREEWRG